MSSRIVPGRERDPEPSSVPLEAEGLCRSFGSLPAIRDVGFSVGRGRSFALVGPDGAGKTTTMRMLCGLLAPDSGSVRVFGRDPRSRPAKDRMGYLSQRFSLYADLSVDENIAFFAEIHGVRNYDERRDRLLEFTRLAPFRDRAAGKLSGGMKQKLALACSLVHGPDLLLMDEPTTGVDPVSRREFWEILGSLLAEGLALVVTTPYMDEAERCDEVALMSRGTLLARGSPADLEAGFPYRILEVPCPDARGAARALAGVPGVSETQTFGDRVDVLVGDAGGDGGGDAGTLAAALDAAGIPHGTPRALSPSLENLFVHILGSEAPSV